MDPALYGLVDFAGYPVGYPALPSGGGFGLSVVEVFFLYRDAARKQAEAEANVRRIELMLSDHEQAVYTKRYNEWRKNWAASYTTLLSEL